eukprot:3537404-Karenia_brevis.AAC.1
MIILGGSPERGNIYQMNVQVRWNKWTCQVMTVQMVNTTFDTSLIGKAQVKRWRLEGAPRLTMAGTEP